MVGFTKPCRRLDQRIENSLQVECRAADGLEDFGCSCLLLQRLAQLCFPVLQLADVSSPVSNPNISISRVESSKSFVLLPRVLLMSAAGLVSRVSPVQTALRNCTRDEGRSFEVGNQVLISSHRKLLLSKAMVVNVAEKSGQDSDRQG